MGLLDSITSGANAFLNYGNPLALGYKVATGKNATDSLGISGKGGLEDQIGLSDHTDPYAPPQLDSGTEGLLGDMQNSTMRDQQAGIGLGKDYSQQTMDGVEANSRPIADAGLSTTNDSLGGNQADAGLGAAIQAKAGKGYDKNLGAVQRQADFQGAVTSVQHSNNFADLETNLANAQRGVDSQVGAYNVQNNATRYAVISGLFKGAGSVAGYHAGKPSPVGGAVGAGAPGGSPFQGGEAESGYGEGYGGGGYAGPQSYTSDSFL